MAQHADGFGLRGYQALETAFHEAGLMVRATGDTIAISPPLMLSEQDIEEVEGKLRQTFKAVFK
jgi:beta-alanine--pyruvate transaminase